MIARIVIVAVLSSSAAVAQPMEQDDPAPRPGTYIARPSGNTVNSYEAASGPHGVTQQGTVPDNSPPPAPGDYPPCSATVTDGCTQTYERGVPG